MTTAHLPSAACDAYWPEIYWNQPMTGDTRQTPYGDTPSPKTFQHVSPLDPQLFTGVADFADELLSGERSGKYSPIEVAQMLEDLADGGEADLAQAGQTGVPERTRLVVDAAIQVGVGRFFAAKLRGGVLYAVFERTGSRRALQESVGRYRRARAYWAEAVDRARGVYAADLSASDRISERGQWVDRLTGIDEDLDRLQALLAGAPRATEPVSAGAAIEAALGRPDRPAIPCTHTPPAGFRPGAEIPIVVAVGRAVTTARLYYRHVNQAERFESVAMAPTGGAYRASVPAAYTDTPYPLQY